MRIFLFLCLLLMGCTVQAENLSLSESDRHIMETYLTNDVMKPNFGGNVYSAYEILDSNKEKGEVYLWALIEEYYVEGEKVDLGSGMSVPMVLHVKIDQGTLQILDHTLPQDGSYYTEDVKKLFPKNTHNKIFNYSIKHITKLSENIQNKVMADY
ncbi:hypothetical protein HNQ94_001088 [Salirhabdus euzebyi]|uniref:DUF3888 domain-containing protein n=1 Tax=Salirhabdus euzebyi TaxID=394506 RepID=A0A841Q2B5_9BACI|nr:hypothetical protein [Salirhabdus euzebyi]MBB6452642.1 hypothetical protein [Salirhabdus euzebyi]